MSTAERPIVVSDLTVEYPARGASAACVALHGVSLTVEPGGVLGVLGESGSGKSTLARLLAGRAFRDQAPRITGGDATVLGHGLRRLGRRARARLTFDVGYLEQDAGTLLEPSWTVAEIVASPIFERDKRFDHRQAEARTAAMLDAVQLPLKVMGRYPYELSGGQRQRVAIARALMLGPRLLIADEPTAGIDVTVRDSVVDLISRLHVQSGFAAVMVSHDVSVLRQSGARIAVLHRGRLVGYGEIDAVLGNPTHPYVADLAKALTRP
jgi:ABC-type dipeptide/oligopeptide/nickel transport system, ATPase component